MAKKQNETLEDILKQQLSKLEYDDKLAKLLKESERDKKIILELKDREKISARTIVLFERKIKFLKENIMHDLLKLCKASEQAKTLAEDYDDGEIKTIINSSLEKLYEICNNLEKLSSISADDKAFILNKPAQLKKEDTQSRFDRLKANFNQKIGESVLRKPGRPKKQDQSIVADIGLGKKVEKIVDEKTETQNKLNEIFYGTPTSQKSVVSAIPTTTDAAFDFSEALNPDHSLKDIMADIMSDMSADNDIVYNKESLDKHLSRLSTNDVEELEAGIMNKPHINNIDSVDTDEVVAEKPQHRNGVFTANKLFDDIKK